MHYANGREAKVGDPAVILNHNNLPVVGIITELIPGAETCNVQLCTDPNSGMSQCLTVNNGLHVEDFQSAIEAVRGVLRDA